MTKVLLYSGGMDSWLIDKLWQPDVKIYVNIDGIYSKDEIARLPEDVKVVDFGLLSEFELPNRFVPLRNLYFLMIASHFGDEICLGATSGDGGVDKSPVFMQKAEEMIAWLWSDKKSGRTEPVRIERRFISMSKAQMIQAYLDMGGSVDEIKESTFSCYSPIGETHSECMSCYPCFRKYALLKSFGAQYTEDEMRRVWDYVRTQVIPTRDEGGYDGTYYTDRGDESIYLVKAVDELKELFG